MGSPDYGSIGRGNRRQPLTKSGLEKGIVWIINLKLENNVPTYMF